MFSLAQRRSFDLNGSVEAATDDNYLDTQPASLSSSTAIPEGAAAAATEITPVAGGFAAASSELRHRTSFSIPDSTGAPPPSVGVDAMSEDRPMLARGGASSFRTASIGVGPLSVAGLRSATHPTKIWFSAISLCVVAVGLSILSAGIYVYHRSDYKSTVASQFADYVRSYNEHEPRIIGSTLVNLQAVFIVTPGFAARRDDGAAGGANAPLPPVLVINGQPHDHVASAQKQNIDGRRGDGGSSAQLIETVTVPLSASIASVPYRFVSGSQVLRNGGGGARTQSTASLDRYEDVMWTAVVPRPAIAVDRRHIVPSNVDGRMRHGGSSPSAAAASGYLHVTATFAVQWKAASSVSPQTPGVSSGDNGVGRGGSVAPEWINTTNVAFPPVPLYSDNGAPLSEACFVASRTETLQYESSTEYQSCFFPFSASSNRYEREEHFWRRVRKWYRRARRVGEGVWGGGGGSAEKEEVETETAPPAVAHAGVPQQRAAHPLAAAASTPPVGNGTIRLSIRSAFDPYIRILETFGQGNTLRVADVDVVTSDVPLFAIPFGAALLGVAAAAVVLKSLCCPSRSATSHRRPSINRPDGIVIDANNDA